MEKAPQIQTYKKDMIIKRIMDLVSVIWGCKDVVVPKGYHIKQYFNGDVYTKSRVENEIRDILDEVLPPRPDQLLVRFETILGDTARFHEKRGDSYMFIHQYNSFKNECVCEIQVPTKLPEKRFFVHWAFIRHGDNFPEAVYDYVFNSVDHFEQAFLDYDILVFHQYNVFRKHRKTKDENKKPLVEW
jgi:hypothetical protein